MRKLFCFVCIIISLATVSQEIERVTPDLKISSEFKDQFNQLDITLFYLYGVKNTGWRKFFLDAFSGLDKSKALTIWGTWYFPYEDGGITKSGNTKVMTILLLYRN